nr:MAG TPA: hypothetical protein [Caudoviricetes sp.]
MPTYKSKELTARIILSNNSISPTVSFVNLSVESLFDYILNSEIVPSFIKNNCPESLINTRPVVMLAFFASSKVL